MNGMFQEALVYYIVTVGGLIKDMGSCTKRCLSVLMQKSTTIILLKSHKDAKPLL